MDGDQRYLAFVWSPAGYELQEWHGEPPNVGATIEHDGKRLTVVKIASSPLPGDRRTCAYLQA